ncbi:ABC-three component system middle component 6 [Campylobacter hyointestinalis]|uniref:ABC-three component system middle component 6 n=1 Tax=Campylobacter hyointestinalis TaxID=198 RepID=UPI003AF9160B
MIMPTKIVKPADSVISISAYILKILKNGSINTDDLIKKLNEIYYKEISIEKMLLCLDFLFIIGKIRSDNDFIELNLR